MQNYGLDQLEQFNSESGWLSSAKLFFQTLTNLINLSNITLFLLKWVGLLMGGVVVVNEAGKRMCWVQLA